MKKTDKMSYREKTITELKKALTEARKKIVENKSKFAVGNLKDTSVFKKLKYEIALILTLIKEKQNENK